MKREYATTADWFVGRGYNPSPTPPPGEGWRLVCMAAVAPLPNNGSVTLFWSWEREQEEPVRRAEMPMTITNLLRSALGLNYKADPYRNHYTANPESEIVKDLEALVVAGLMKRGKMSDEVVYHATPAGIATVWGRLAIYEPTGDECVARDTDKKAKMLWTAADKGRFKTGDVYQVSKSALRWL